jgi:hypothetical protein
MAQAQKELDEEDQRVLSLSTLVMLQAEARKKGDIPELSFLAVNETHRLVNYRQCVFWSMDEAGKVKIENVSGLSVIDNESPYLVWLERLIKSRVAQSTEPQKLTQATIEEEYKNDWEEWCSKYVLLIPLKISGGVLYGLWLDRKTDFSQGELRLLQELSDSYAYCLDYLQKGKQVKKGFIASRKKALAAILLFLLFLFPSRLSVTAPAEVIPLEPYVVSSPLDGAIEEVFVKPNQEVDRGELLAKIDSTDLKNSVEISTKELAVAQAAFEKTSREAFNDTNKKAELEVLKAEVETQKAKVNFTRELLSKTEILAARAGVVVFSDPNDIRGAPVSTGQKIMLIADPDKTQLLVRIPVDAFIELDREEPISFYLNIAPLKKVKADINVLGYEASPDQDGLMTYKLKAMFTPNEQPPGIGLKGTAKVYGPRTILGYKILRRPLMWLRRHWGL